MGGWGADAPLKDDRGKTITRFPNTMGRDDYGGELSVRLYLCICLPVCLCVYVKKRKGEGVLVHR